MSRSTPTRRGLLIGCMLGWCCGLTPTAAQDPADEQIETMETIEVTAPVVIREKRHIKMPEPEATTFMPLPDLITATTPRTRAVSQRAPAIVRDSIADRKGIRKPVRPIKADRPPYPQIARKRGWEGTVVLRLTVNGEGTVEEVDTHKSSGFPELDESARQAVRTWRFSPAKDGEFPISATVDLPVRFDLDEYKR